MFAKQETNSGWSDYDEKAIFFTQIPNDINEQFSIKNIVLFYKQNKIKKQNRSVLI